MRVLGLVLNNPANIQRGSAWKGLSKIQKHKRFCTFESRVYGIRALIVLLRTYHYKYKLNTIEKVIHRYAPLSENNTYEYIVHVQKWMTEMYNTDGLLGSLYYVQDNAPFCWFSNPKSLTFACRCLVKCICRQETGYVVTDDVLDSAIDLI